MAQCIAHRIKTAKNIRGKKAVPKDEIFAAINGALKSGRRINPVDEREQIQKRATAALGIIRSVAGTKNALAENVKQLQKHLSSGVKDRPGIRAWLKNIDLLITERAMLDASELLLNKLERSRGGFVYEDLGECPRNDSFMPFRAISKQSHSDKVIETWLDKKGDAHSEFVPVRALPEPDVWFEAVWARFVKGEVFES